MRDTRVDRSLEGRCVLVTRPREQASELTEMLRERGAIAVPAPAIRVLLESVELDRAAREIAGGGFDWVILTSRAGVEALFSGMGRGGLESASGPRFAVVGEGTAEALRQKGVNPDLVPDEFTTSALARAMPEGDGRVLLARADIAGTELESALEAKGWTTVRVNAYRTEFCPTMPPSARRALLEGRIDALTFTSASTVQGFRAMAEGILPPRRPKVVCIGPVTARAARRAGLPVDALARPHTIEGLVAALERVLHPSEAERSR